MYYLSILKPDVMATKGYSFQDDEKTIIDTLTPKNFGGKKFGGKNFGHFLDISAENISDTFFKVEDFLDK